jgi:hypothetical protein
MARNPKEDNPEEFGDLFDPTYQGNVFGWKLSFMGLGIILLALGTIIYRHITMGVSFTGGGRVTPAVIDTLEQVVRDSI